MSLPVVYLLGFGEAGSLARQSLVSAESSGIDARYIALPGTFADIARPQPDLWRQIRDAIQDENEALVVWGHDTLVVWDRLLRARAVSHHPDFLWPLPLRLSGSGIEVMIPNLFTATGSFELSLYPLTDLYGFQHAVTARALTKLLAVSDIEKLNFADYLSQAWINFESVKAPDTWALHTEDNATVFANTPVIGAVLAKFNPVFLEQNQQWVMERQALDARSRNTLAISEFVKSNLGENNPQIPALMQQHPYYGFWPVRAGRIALSLPCHGYHPVVAEYIWRTGYHTHAADLWSAVFCRGAYSHAIDTRDDGHFFGLLFARQNANGKTTCVSKSIREASWAQSAVETNALANVTISIGGDVKDADGVAVCTADTAKKFWGAMDLFVPLASAEDIAAFHSMTLPKGYIAYAYDSNVTNLDTVEDLKNLHNAAALIVIHKDHQARLTGGKR